MAGRGPAPKDSDYRARGSRSDKGHDVRELSFKPARQPALTAVKRPDGMDWPARTVVWWQKWGQYEQSKLFTDSDWDFLLDTAFLHAAYVEGDLKLAAELRLREAKYGKTPEDRARLRWQASEGDEKPADGPKEASGAKAREQYGHLRAVN